MARLYFNFFLARSFLFFLVINKASLKIIYNKIERRDIKRILSLLESVSLALIEDGFHWTLR